MIRISWKYVVFSALVMWCTPGFGALLDAQTRDGVVYFTLTDSNKVVRYHLDREEFLPELLLPETPREVAVNDSHFIVGYERSLYKIDLESTQQSFLANTSFPITQVATLMGKAYVSEGSSNLQVINLFAGERIGFGGDRYTGTSMIASEINNALYMRNNRYSPSDIYKIVIDDIGDLLSTTDSPYHGAYPRAEKLFLTPDESRIIDSAGIVYAATDLTYAGSLAGPVDNVTFIGERIFVQRGSLLIEFNDALLEQGRATLAQAPTYLASTADTLLAFTVVGNEVSVAPVEFHPEAPEAALNPDATTYVADITEFDVQTGRLFLLDRETRSLFVWSAVSESYTGSFRLLEEPTWASYSPSTERLYLGFASGRISSIDPSSPTAVETPMVNLPSRVLGLKAAGNYLFAVDGSGAWNTHYSFSFDGQLLDSVDWHRVGSEYLWNPALGRVYHLRDGISPNDIHWSEISPLTGKFTAFGESPYHDSIYAAVPLRLDPTQTAVLTGRGNFHDASTLGVVNALSAAIADAAWINADLYTLASPLGSRSLQIWSETLQLQATISLARATSRIYAFDGSLLLLQSTSAGTTFDVVDVSADTDGDGVSDIQDNCPDISNSDQQDLDGDAIGNICDQDDDNDGIDDDVELSLGLNPHFAADAGFDRDSDGFTNLDELVSGSDPLDAASQPSVTSFFYEDFDSGSFNSALRTSPTSDAPWSIDSTTRVSGTSSLRSGSIGHNQDSVLLLTGRFPAGTLTFDLKSEGEPCCDYLFISFNGIIETSYAYEWSAAWTRKQIAIPEGVREISFTYRKDMIISSGSDAVWIDNLRFEAGPAPLPVPSPQPLPEPIPQPMPAPVEEIPQPGADTDGPQYAFSSDTFFMLGNYTWTYEVAGTGQRFDVVSKPTSDPTVFEVSVPGGVDRYERWPEGIVVTRSEMVVDGKTFTLDLPDGLLILPSKLNPGEQRVVRATGTFSGDGQMVEVTYEQVITHADSFDYQYKGHALKAVGVQTVSTIYFSDSYSETNVGYSIYAEGVGEVFTNTDEVEYELTNMVVSTAESPAPSNTNNVTVLPGVSGKGGGGSASASMLAVLLFCLIGHLGAASRRHQSGPRHR